ncbi:MAG: enoyl-CoA hydratase [Kangiellaceae bacterium]|nr:enoyl-CoA hydratase [Kangiellaceae bacterium]
MSELVKTFVEKGVFHIELHRANKKNSLIAEMYLALREALVEAQTNDKVHVILFKGGKNCFCAGNDIADFLNESVLDTDGPIASFLHELADVQKPIIAAVSGPAIGIGTTLLLHCDLVYATEQSVFSLPFVNLGVCAEAGSSYLLSRQIGHVRAAELLLFGEAFDAQKAKTFGLINDIVDSDSYWEFAQQQAEKLAAKPLQALMVNKQLMKPDNELVHQIIEQEIIEFSRLIKTEDAKTIFKKFLSR